jgi:hypothetical protein
MAAQTNAIVFAHAVPARSILTRCLTRMYAVHKAKWNGRAPFTIVQYGVVTELYANSNERASLWKKVREQSPAWTNRHAVLQSIMQKNIKEKQTNNQDLDDNGTFVVLCDGLDYKKIDRAGLPGVNMQPLNDLVESLVRRLSNTLPSLTLKTGNASKSKLENVGQGSIGRAVNVAHSGVRTRWVRKCWRS